MQPLTALEIYKSSNHQEYRFILPDPLNPNLPGITCLRQIPPEIQQNFKSVLKDIGNDSGGLETWGK